MKTSVGAELCRLGMLGGDAGITAWQKPRAELNFQRQGHSNLMDIRKFS